MTVSFSDLQEANKNRKKEWHKDNVEEWMLVDWSNELAGETGETCDVVKKLRRVETGVTKRGPRTSLELLTALRKEVADVVICADLLATAAGFTLGDAVREKFNETSVKHGLNVRL